MSNETKVWTILAVLDWTRGHFEQKGIDAPRLDAELLLAHALGLERVMLYAKFDQPLTPEELTRIRGIVARRARGEPVAYLVEEREFWSMRLEVRPGVLIPRPDTETLVEISLSAIKNRTNPVIADVGTGSGCIALALAKERPDARVFALDTSSIALEIAGRNRTRHGLDDRVTFLRSDLLRGLPQDASALDLVVANLPYIPTGEIPTLMRDVKDFEPREALDGGDDGLHLVRTLAAEARERLRRGGIIALEVGHDQADRALAILKHEGYSNPVAHKDHGDIERVVMASFGQEPG